MKKLILSLLIVGAVSETVHAHLVAHNMNATGTTALQGAVITTISVAGSLSAGHTTFGTISLNGDMIVTDSTITTITVSNAIIGPSDEPVILVASTVSGNITFTGAYGKVVLRNGSTIGGSVINGSIVVE